MTTLHFHPSFPQAELVEVIDDFIYSLQDYCPPISNLIQDYIYATVEERLSNGQRYKLYETKNGIRHGTFVMWLPNGNLHCIAYYVDGVQQGEEHTWYNGFRYAKTTFVDGLEHGEHIRWFRNNEVQSVTPYFQGEPHGEHKEWNETGQLIGLTTFHQGIQHGPHIEWYPNGQVSYYVIFEQGEELDNGLHFNEEGEQLFSDTEDEDSDEDSDYDMTESENDDTQQGQHNTEN